jgi:ferritin-like metal-binding protein YciE
MKIESLNDLFTHKLQATYYAEQEIIKALPKMIEASQSPELKQSFSEHLSETRQQLQRLEQIFQAMGQKPETSQCDIIDANIGSCEKLIKHSEPGATRDAGLIAGAQSVEHYEIVHYGTLASWAKDLRLTQIVPLLEATLKEEHNANSVLTRCATEQVNQGAARMAKAA